MHCKNCGYNRWLPLILIFLSFAVPAHALEYGFYGLLMQPDTRIEIDGKTAWVVFPLQMNDPSEWKYHDCFTLSYLSARSLRAKGIKARLADLRISADIDGQTHWLSHTICVVDIGQNNMLGIVDKTPLNSTGYINESKLRYLTKKQENDGIAEYAYHLKANFPIGVFNGVYLLIRISVHPYGTQYIIQGHRFDTDGDKKFLQFRSGGIMGIIVENGKQSEIKWQGKKLPEIARFEPLLHHMIKITKKR